MSGKPWTSALVLWYTLLYGAHGHHLDVALSPARPLSIGEDLTVRCRLEDFGPGDGGVWWKRQGAEEVRLGTNNVLDVALDRYTLNVQQSGTTMVFFLNIRGIEAEDNGEFGCSSLADEDHKTYMDVVVSDPVRSVRLFSMASANPDAEPLAEFQDGEEFFFHDGQDYFFQCVASGSNPPPTMDVTIGYLDGVEDLTDKFSRSDNLISDPSSGDYGFRRTNYEAVLTSNQPIVVHWKANSQEFKCAASVPNMESPKTIHFKPVMKIPPVIECAAERKVPIWTEDVEIVCEVYADPELQVIRWYWGNDVKATSLGPGDTHGAYQFVLQDGSKPDMKIAKLKIDQTFVEMYLKYNLVAKNIKGVAFHQFTLRRDPDNE